MEVGVAAAGPRIGRCCGSSAATWRTRKTRSKSWTAGRPRWRAATRTRTVPCRPPGAASSSRVPAKSSATPTTAGPRLTWRGSSRCSARSSSPCWSKEVARTATRNCRWRRRWSTLACSTTTARRSHPPAMISDSARPWDFSM